MKKATIIFGSTTGNTEIVADKIAETMTGYDVQVIYVTDAKDDTAVKEADLVLYGCSTMGLGELQDITEVEYRKVRLERVVLVGVWSSAVTTQAKAEESLRELAALAQTAGAEVCDGLLQHRSRPDAATYVGAGKRKGTPTTWAGRLRGTRGGRHHRGRRRPAAKPASRLGRRRQGEGGGPYRRDPRHFRPACHIA